MNAVYEVLEDYFVMFIFCIAGKTVSQQSLDKHQTKERKVLEVFKIAYLHI